MKALLFSSLLFALSDCDSPKPTAQPEVEHISKAENIKTATPFETYVISVDGFKYLVIREDKYDHAVALAVTPMYTRLPDYYTNSFGTKVSLH